MTESMHAPAGRNLRVAFCGASGTGKTSLAEFVASKYSLPLNPVGARSVAAAMGFSSPYAAETPDERRAFQERLLEEKFAWETEQPRFVTDRTPLDNLAYVMMHGGAGGVSDRYLQMLEANLALYTRIFFCPTRAFHKIGDDPMRRKDLAYHQLFEAALKGLIEHYVPFHRVFLVESSESLLRRTFVDMVLS